MYDNSDFFNDDLNFILTLSKEEYRYNDLLFNKMKKVMDNVRNMKGINKNIALEANRVYDDLNVRVNRLTDEISTVGYSAAMEEMSKGMMALIAAGIAAFVAMIWKISGFLTGESSSGGSTSGYGGGGSIENKIKVAEVTSEVIKEAVNSVPKISEQRTQVVNTITNEMKTNNEFANEMNTNDEVSNSNDVNKVIDDLRERIDSTEPLFDDSTLLNVRYYLAFIDSSPGTLLNESNDFNKILVRLPTVINYIKDLYTKTISEIIKGNSNNFFTEQIKKSEHIDFFNMSDTPGLSESPAFDYVSRELNSLKSVINTNDESLINTLKQMGGDGELSTTQKVSALFNLFMEKKIFDKYAHYKIYILKMSERFTDLNNALDKLHNEFESMHKTNNDVKEMTSIGNMIRNFINKIRRTVIDITGTLSSLKRSLESIEYVITETLECNKKSKKIIENMVKHIEKTQTINEQTKKNILDEIKKLNDIQEGCFSFINNLSSKLSNAELSSSGNKVYRLHKAAQSSDKDITKK